MPESSPAADNLVSEILALIGRDGSESASVPGDLFASASKKQLLDCAARLGLKGVAKLSREDLADRIEVAFAGLAGLPPAGPGAHEVLEPSGAAEPVNGGGGILPAQVRSPAEPRHRADAQGHSLGLRPRPHHRDARRSAAPLRLLGGHRHLDRRRARGPGTGGRTRLAERPRLRHHGPVVRRHQRAQLLRPPASSATSASGSSSSTSRRPTRAPRSASGRRKATSSRSPARAASSFPATSRSVTAASSG